MQEHINLPHWRHYPNHPDYKLPSGCSTRKPRCGCPGHQLGRVKLLHLSAPYTHPKSLWFPYLICLTDPDPLPHQIGTIFFFFSLQATSSKSEIVPTVRVNIISKQLRKKPSYVHFGHQPQWLTTSNGEGFVDGVQLVELFTKFAQTEGVDNRQVTCL